MTSEERMYKIEKINEDIKELEELRKKEIEELTLEAKALTNFLHKEKTN